MAERSDPETDAADPESVGPESPEPGSPDPELADADPTGAASASVAAETDSLSLDEALSILGEPTRARIVVALGRARRPDGVTPAALPFSELMDRVGVEDSGRFNYHLGELVGAFVAKVEDGYLLRPPGHFLYRSIVAGTLTERPSLEPFEAGDCPDCGATLAVESPATHCLAVRCPDCGQVEHTVHLTPRGVEGRSRGDLLEAAVRKSRSSLGLMVQGVCHACGAPVDRELTRDGPAVCASRCDYDVYAVVSCSACNAGGAAHPAHVALTAPAVVGFFDDHGRDARVVGHWEQPVPDAEAETSVVAEDPLAVAVPFDLDGDGLRVVLDDDLRAVEADPVDE